MLEVRGSSLDPGGRLVPGPDQVPAEDVAADDLARCQAGLTQKSLKSYIIILLVK